MKLPSPRLIVAVACLAVAAAADATLTSVENAYESSPRDVRLPIVESGLLTVLPCSGCQPVSLRTTAETLYFIGGPDKEPASLADMREAVQRAPSAESLLVIYRLEDKVVTRVILDLR